MTDTSIPVRLRSTAVARELALEHVALVRQLAGLQLRVSEQLLASARRLTALQAQNIRLRGELVTLRTAVAWDLRSAALVPRPAPSQRRALAARDPALSEAQTVICQTGCAGHAHPWLDPDGQCRRTGQACDRLESDGAALSPDTQPGNTSP